jgi:predicted  nucleic acid-binding Zn-ribbon protein
MTSIEKTKISISTAVTVLSVLATAGANYYSSKTAIHDAFNEVKIEINDLRNEDKLIRKDVTDLEKRTSNIEAAAMTYLNKTSK